MSLRLPNPKFTEDKNVDFVTLKQRTLLKAKRRELIEATKKRDGCMRCDMQDPRILEFHHLDTSQKNFSIADYYYSQYGIVKLEKEIAKCVVICANCPVFFMLKSVRRH